MRIEYDPDADALYFALNPVARVHDTLEAAPGVNVDVDAKGTPVGIEVLYAVRRLGRDALTTLGVDLSGLKWSPVQDRLVSTGEAAKILGVSRQYVARLAAQNRLSAVRTGRSWLIKHSSLERIRGRGLRQPAKHKTRAAR